MNDSPQYEPLTVQQAAIGCGVGDDTIRNYIKDGRLRPLGKFAGNRGAYYFDFDTVARFALARRLRAVGLLNEPGATDYPRIGREKEQTLDDLADQAETG